MLLFAVFFVYVLLYTFYTSFTDWRFVSPVKNFIGLRNYLDLFHDSYFHIALKNTLLLSSSVPVGMALSLGLALMLNARWMRLKGMFRTGFFVPVVISMVIWAMIWRGIYSANGVLNQLLGMLGISGRDWLADLKWAFPAIILMGVIKGLGYNMVLYLAGLQSIPSHLYDAAKIDGATPWQEFRNVTLPCLHPTTFFVSVTSVISSFQVFDQIYVMTRGGPLGRTEVLVTYLYNKGFLAWEMGYANAVAVILFLLVLILVLIQRKLIPQGVQF